MHCINLDNIYIQITCFLVFCKCKWMLRNIDQSSSTCHNYEDFNNFNKCFVVQALVVIAIMMHYHGFHNDQSLFLFMFIIMCIQYLQNLPHQIPLVNSVFKYVIKFPLSCFFNISFLPHLLQQCHSQSFFIVFFLTSKRN